MKFRKFTILLLTFFFFGSSCYAITFNVMSFNLGANSNSRNRSNNLKWIKNIAEIITISEADIVLLQEAPILSNSDMEGEFLRALKNELKKIQKNKTWQSLSTFDNPLKNKQITTKSPSFTLNNAMLYNSGIFSAMGNGTYPIKFSSDKSLDYRSRFNNNQVVQFKDKNSSQNFLVINVHMYYQNPQEDLQILGNIIRDYCSSDSKYCSGGSYIVAGDFNMGIGDIYNSMIEYRILNFLIDGYKNPQSSNGLKTTISNSQNSKHNLILANDYDHFLYHGNIRSNETIHHVFSTKNTDLYKNDFKKEISDHLPVVMTFCLE